MARSRKRPRPYVPGELAALTDEYYRAHRALARKAVEPMLLERAKVLAAAVGLPTKGMRIEWKPDR